MKLILTKEESNYMTIISVIVNRGRKYCTKDYGNREHIVSCKNIKINHVSVDGNAIYCSGNIIEVGFKNVEDVVSGETGEVMGTRTEVTNITAKLSNSKNLYLISFDTSIMSYEFVLNK